MLKGCDALSKLTLMQVLVDYQYVFDDSYGPITLAFKGTECISYLAVGYRAGHYNFEGLADVDGFISTYSDYLTWADGYFDDGKAMQVADSSCSSAVPYCTATVKGLDPAETYVVSIASGYDDVLRQSLGRAKLAFSAGSQGKTALVCGIAAMSLYSCSFARFLPDFSNQI